MFTRGGRSTDRSGNFPKTTHSVRRQRRWAVSKVGVPLPMQNSTSPRTVAARDVRGPTPSFLRRNSMLGTWGSLNSPSDPCTGAPCHLFKRKRLVTPDCGTQLCPPTGGRAPIWPRRMPSGHPHQGQGTGSWAGGPGSQLLSLTIRSTNGSHPRGGMNHSLLTCEEPPSR